MLNVICNAQYVWWVPTNDVSFGKNTLLENKEGQNFVAKLEKAKSHANLI